MLRRIRLLLVLGTTLAYARSSSVRKVFMPPVDNNLWGQRSVRTPCRGGDGR